MSRIFKIFLWIYIGLRIVAPEEDIIDCNNEDLVTSVFNEPIDLTWRGTIRVYENISIHQITSTTNNEFPHNYIDARLERNAENGTTDLVIFTTDLFENYAKEQTASRLTLKIVFSCDMGRERVLVFFQPFREGNYFSPEFSKSLYELVVPMPLFRGFDLTTFGEITARDDDLVNNQITFVSPDSERYHIRVATKNHTSDKKTYSAHLTLERIWLELAHDNITFQIVAQDSGVPSRNASSTVRIRAYLSNSMPPRPRFGSTCYWGSINMNLTMDPVAIALEGSGHSSDVTCSLFGKDGQWFRLERKDGQMWHIELNESPLNRNVLHDRSHLEVEVRAQHSHLAEYSAAVVFVTLPRIQESFHFSKSLYEGHIEEGGRLDMESIVFNPEAYSEDITFHLLPPADRYFNLSQLGHQLRLELVREVPVLEAPATDCLTLTVAASLDDHYKASTHILLRRVPPKRPPDFERMMQFEKPLYVGMITRQHSLEMEVISLQQNGADLNGITFTLSGEHKELFELSLNGSHVVLHLKVAAANQTDLERSPILLVLAAQRNNSTAYASLVIKKEGDQVARWSDVFASRWLLGRIQIDKDRNQILSIGEIPFKGNLQELVEASLNFHLKGNQSSHFNIKRNTTGHKATLELISSLPTHVLDTTSQIHLELQASASHSTGGRVNDTLLILIELPLSNCSKASPSPSAEPQFVNKEYIFAATPTEKGSLGAVSAFVRGSNASIRYTLLVSDETLEKRLTINSSSGELMLLSHVTTGSYSFEIQAENVETLETARVKALLQVEPQKECTYLKHPTVDKTLLVKHIEEEREYFGLMDMTLTANCSFHLIDMWPQDKEFVHINESTRMLDVSPVDREDEIFSSMLQPQIRLKLKLHCSDQSIPEISAKTHDFAGTSTLILSDDIPFAKDIMWLHLIIDDINDNPPTFVYPKKPTYLGYPATGINFELFPPHLIQVKAVDRDEGLNARILYRMRDNNYFDIDGESGVIHPSGSSLAEGSQTELIVLATDREGQGLSSGSILMVRSLSAEYFTLLTLTTNTTRSLDEISHELSKRTGYKVVVLKQATLPLTEQRRSSHRSRKFVEKLWLYAYHDAQPVTSRKLKRKLSETQETAAGDVLSVASYDEVGVVVHSREDQSVSSGLVASIVVLALICVVCLGFFVRLFWCDRHGSSGWRRTTTTKNTLSDSSNGSPTAVYYKNEARSEEDENCK